MAYIYETNYISRDSASHKFDLSAGSQIPSGFRLSKMYGHGNILGVKK